MNRSAMIVGALGALLACGCESLEPSWPSYYGYIGNSMFNARNLGTVQAGGPVPLTVHGAPFAGVPPDAFARAVAAGMSGGNAGPKLTLIPAPAARADNYRVVAAFGAPRPGGENLCQATDPAVPPTRRTLHAEAAFCAGTNRVTEIQGDLPGAIAGPDDPKFRSFLQGLSNALMPPYTHNRGPCRPGDC
jgi:hypothetical protein